MALPGKVGMYKKLASVRSHVSNVHSLGFSRSVRLPVPLPLPNEWVRFDMSLIRYCWWLESRRSVYIYGGVRLLNVWLQRNFCQMDLFVVLVTEVDNGEETLLHLYTADSLSKIASRSNVAVLASFVSLDGRSG